MLHFRDCGDYRNRLPRRYHAGETSDIRFFVESLRTAGHTGPMMAAGFSLGGNVLLKYLGENGVSTPLQAAAAISVPLSLHDSANALSRGFSKVYQYYLLKRMKSAIGRKFDQYTAAFDWQRAMNARSFADFDDAVTAPLHGFSGKDDYYDRCSSIDFLAGIRRPNGEMFPKLSTILYSPSGPGARIASCVTKSSDGLYQFKLCVQGVGRFQRLKNGDQITRRNTDGVEAADDIANADGLGKND